MKKRGNIIRLETVAAAAIGAAGSVASSLALCALAARLVGQEIIGDSTIDIMVVGILVPASAIGALLACTTGGRPRLPVCLLTGVTYYLVLIGCNAMLFDGAYQALGATAIAVFGGCGAVSLMGTKGEKRGVRVPRSKKSNWKVVQN